MVTSSCGRAASSPSPAHAKTYEKLCSKLEGHEHDRIRIVRDLDALAEETFVVEAVVEEHEPKAAVLSELAGHVSDDAILSTTTSSLSIEALARATGNPERFLGLHVFNPVPRMKLVELVFPAEATSRPGARARACARRSARPPSRFRTCPGFVVNRLLFPYLFTPSSSMAETACRPRTSTSA